VLVFPDGFEDLSGHPERAVVDVNTLVNSMAFIPRNVYNTDHFKLTVGYSNHDSFFVVSGRGKATLGLRREAKHGEAVHELVHFMAWVMDLPRNSFLEELNAYLFGWFLDHDYLHRDDSPNTPPWERDPGFDLDWDLLHSKMSQAPERRIVKAVSVILQQLKPRPDVFLRGLLLLDRAAWELEQMIRDPSYSPKTFGTLVTAW